MGLTNSASVAAGSADVTPAMTTFNLSFGFTATAGRVLILVLAADKSVGTPTTPSGYTAGPSIVNTDVSLVTYYKTAAGTETTVTFAWSTTIRMAGGYVMERDDITVTGLLTNSASSGTGTTRSQTTGNVTAPTDVSSVGVACWAMDSVNSYPDADPLTGQPSWSNSFSRVAGQNDDSGEIPGGNGGFPGWSVATRSVAVSAGTISSTASYTGGTADQHAACILLFPRLGATLTGAMTPTGALARSTARAFTGGGTSAGALARSSSRALTGGATPAGALIRSLARILAGSQASAGALARTAARALTGAASSAGALVRAAQKPLTGSAASSGALATAHVFASNLAGAMTPAGVLARDAARALAGAAASTGVLVRSTTRALVGVLSSAGEVARAMGRALGGAITPVGALVRATTRALTGAAPSVGTLDALRTFVSDLSGGLASAGALANTANKALAGALPSSGTLLRATVRDLAGTLTSAGALVRAAARGLVGALGPTGALARGVGRALAGAQGAAGSLVAALVVALPLGQIRRVLDAVRRGLVRAFRLGTVEAVRRVAVREDDVQTVNFSPKGAGETDFFTLDWADYPLDDGETITAIDTTVAAGAVTVAAEQIDGLNTTVQISGGTGGTTARVEVQIATSAGRVLEREMVFRVIA